MISLIYFVPPSSVVLQSISLSVGRSPLTHAHEQTPASFAHEKTTTRHRVNVASPCTRHGLRKIWSSARFYLHLKKPLEKQALDLRIKCFSIVALLNAIGTSAAAF